MHRTEPLLMLGCGILKKEIDYLIAKHKWPVDSLWFDSSLHVDFSALELTLRHALQRNQQRCKLVFYGTCHPLMDKILGQDVRRVAGQNCVDILLGNELFTEKLAEGAFFLLEDWALHWEHVTARTFGSNPVILREIFQLSHTHLLCLRTPCSGDFSAAAAAVGQKVGLPLRWLDVSLDNLESVLLAGMQSSKEVTQCPNP